MMSVIFESLDLLVGGVLDVLDNDQLFTRTYNELNSMSEDSFAVAWPLFVIASINKGFFYFC